MKKIRDLVIDEQFEQFGSSHGNSLPNKRKLSEDITEK